MQKKLLQKMSFYMYALCFRLGLYQKTYTVLQFVLILKYGEVVS